MSTATQSPPYAAQPSLFVPHGAPTFALNPGAAGAAIAREAAHLAGPRAVIVVSAHWDTAVPTVGFASRLDTLHDFRGFPEELYRIRYPATGCPRGSAEVVAALQGAGFTTASDPDRGLDHGAWVPLRIMYPDADVPVIPLSIQSALGPLHHLRLGRALAPLAARGFLVVGSGNLTHNLGDYLLALRSGGQTPGYVRDFADWVWRQLESGDERALVDYRSRARDGVRAQPQDDHLLPLFVALGAAGERARAARFHAGVDDFVLAMDAFEFSAEAGV
jgi:4,5-DOPA dioxygenase extradiol